MSSSSDNSAGILGKISEVVDRRRLEREAIFPFKELQRRAESSREPHSPVKRFLGDGFSIIAEIKFASPSHGRFTECGQLDAVTVAQQYLAAGAHCLSVLTEADHFQGSFENLRRVRTQFHDAAILLKDFLTSEYQVYEARALGADVVLLIVALLGESKSRDLSALAQSLGLETLIEVHDAEELEIAHRLGAKLIGVNNRNLRTLKIDLATSFDLAQQFARDTVYVAESGLSEATEIAQLHALGYSAFLLGSSLMRTGQPGVALDTLLKKLSSRR